jgi:predicted nucleic acid-binding protein
MKRVFADTFHFLAQLNPADEAHQKAEDFIASFEGILLTTDWVLVELADALARPPNRPRFISFYRQLLGMPDITIVPADHLLLAQGFALYAQRADKEWSLTDCISFVLMQREGLTEALTGDHHFEQAGFVALLK